MEHEDYIKKRNNLSMSEASLEDRTKAIEELDDKFNASKSIEIAKLQFEESAPDIGTSDE